MAETQLSSNGTTFLPQDSTVYNYSGNRGGDLKHTLKYDNSYMWTYDTAYANSYYYIQTFDANNNITSKTTQYWNGTAWVNYSKTLYTYNSSNQMTTMILQSWNGSSWAPVAQDVYNYNAAGYLATDLYQQWDALTSGWDNVTLKAYYYDAMNNKINETDQNYVSGSPIYTYQWAYTYSSTNQILTNTYSTWNGTTWTPNTMTTNTYDTTGDEISMLMQTWNAATSTWTNSTLDLYSNFVSGTSLAQKDIRQNWVVTSGTGSWVNATQYTNTYNSFNQLTSTTGESWNVSGLFEYASGDPMTRYYYQTYSTTAVTNVTNNAGADVKVYPVPAKGILNVDVNWNNAQVTNMVMYTAQGNIVRQWATPSAAQYHTNVSVDNLSDGIYFLSISGVQGQVVKQIVVAH